MCDPLESVAYPFDPAFRLLGRRWAAEIMFQIISGTVRFSQLQRALSGISPRTLSVRIAEFEDAGVITRTRGIGSECVYTLTQKGLALKQMLGTIAAFTIQWHRPI